MNAPPALTFAAELPPCELTQRATRAPLLLWAVTGSARVTAAGADVEVPAGFAAVIEAGTQLAVTTAPGAVVLPIWLAPDDPALRGGQRVSLLTVPEDWHDYLVFLFAQNLGYLRSSTANRMSLLELMAAAGAGGSERDLLPPLPWSQPAFGLAHLLLRSPDAVGSVEDLGAQFGMSPRTVQRRFLDETGLSFSTWRTHARIGAAEAYLADGHSPGWVSGRVGFENPSSFTRCFRRITGMTPKAYQRTHASQDRQGPRGGGLALLKSPGQRAPMVPRCETWPQVNASHVAVWMYRGAARVTIGEQRWRLRQGEALILPAGVRNHVQTEPGALLLPLGFRSPAEKPLAPLSLAPVDLTGAETLSLLHSLVCTYSPLRAPSHDPNAVFDAVAGRAGDALPLSSGLVVAGRTNSQTIASLATHLANHPEESTSLTTWARRLGTDPATLRRELQTVTGGDYRHWRQLSRMTRARGQLLRGLPPSVVAKNLGYSHLSGFSRAFTTTYGMSPRQYLDEHAASPAASARRAVELGTG